MSIQASLSSLSCRRPFAQRYNVLLAVGKGEYAPLDMQALDDDTAAQLSKRILIVSGLKGWQLGKSRIFLRAGQLAQLEVCSVYWFISLRPSRPSSA